MFDSTKELLDKIRLVESSFLELKEVRFGRDRVIGPPDKNVADELAAFANSNGGVCVFGVSDRPREVLGIPLHRLDAVVGHVRHSCSLVEPTLHPVVDRLWPTQHYRRERSRRQGRDKEKPVRAPKPFGLPPSSCGREASHVH